MTNVRIERGMTIMNEPLNPPIDSKLLKELNLRALEEGRSLTTLIDEAITEYLATEKSSAPRKKVMDAYHATHAHFGEVYKKLAE